MRYVFLIVVSLILFSACSNDEAEDSGIDLTYISYDPVDYSIVIPDSFPIFEQNPRNLMTEDGVALGRELFYDPIMSIDSTISCSSCHLPELNFTDQLAVSVGVHGGFTSRSSMSLLNVGFFYNGLFWDGRAENLEEQAAIPVEDEIEMDDDWTVLTRDIQIDDRYPELFRKAFGISNSNEINKDLITKAIAQFERSLISSGNSKYDKVIRGQAAFTDEEQMGFDIFFDRDPELPDGECFHCHSAPLLSNNEYMNNGIDEAFEFEDFTDLGRGGFTDFRAENGKFRVPSLRNIEFTAPYMHDGRFQTLEEVLVHYNSGGKESKGKNALLVPLGLTDEQLEALRAFLSTLNDEDFLNDEKFSNPNG